MVDFMKPFPPSLSLVYTFAFLVRLCFFVCIYRVKKEFSVTNLPAQRDLKQLLKHFVHWCKARAQGWGNFFYWVHFVSAAGKWGLVAPYAMKWFYFHDHPLFFTLHSLFPPRLCQTSLKQDFWEDELPVEVLEELIPQCRELGCQSAQRGRGAALQMEGRRGQECGLVRGAGMADSTVKSDKWMDDTGKRKGRNIKNEHIKRNRMVNSYKTVY